MNIKNNITMTKQEPTLQQIAHEIYTSHQEMGTLKQWREDPRYNELHTIARSEVFDMINNFIRQDYF